MSAIVGVRRLGLPWRDVQMCSRPPSHIPGNCPYVGSISLLEEYDPRKELWWPVSWWEWTYHLAFALNEPKVARLVFDYFDTEGPGGKP